MVAILLVASVVLVLAAGITLYSSLEKLEDGELEALIVGGEMRAVLRPGLNFVPPYVSETYPIDPTTMQIDKGSKIIEVPADFRDDVREHATE